MVPVSVRVAEPVRVVAITGPNTGGKTVTLKAVGLAALMARAGLFLPCGAPPRLPWCAQVLADIGDEQSLQQNLSTFSGHIRRIARILEALPGSEARAGRARMSQDASSLPSQGKPGRNRASRLGCTPQRPLRTGRPVDPGHRPFDFQRAGRRPHERPHPSEATPEGIPRAGQHLQREQSSQASPRGARPAPPWCCSMRWAPAPTPRRAAALAIALLRRLADRARLTIATTHFGELKALKYADPRFENASVAFDVETLSPTYHLQWGIPGRSNALAIAARLGLRARGAPGAEALLGPSGEGDANAVIAGLESSANGNRRQRRRQRPCSPAPNCCTRNCWSAGSSKKSRAPSCRSSAARSWSARSGPARGRCGA